MRILIIVCAIAWICHPAFAVESVQMGKVHASGTVDGWEIKVVSGKAKIVQVLDGDMLGVCFDSVNSSFYMQKPIDIDSTETPVLSWRWRVDILPASGDIRESHTDDQAAQILIAFGKKALGYVWDTNAPINTTGSFYIPLVVDLKIIVVQNKEAGKTHEWGSMSRNIRDDFLKLFGEEAPKKVTGVRFQVNSQHTRSRAVGCVSYIGFSK